ncbi:MAG: hypothetical protein ACTJGD_05265 [Mesonia hippocampi]|uniref:Uncharacterized protein n=1 Tax=Mesonia hippocampi TaxID=1628250 RepID=A0A840EUK0_9FLAO|nr:hypothetical protein [Mesonia hippocampi]MBB4119146.1 hypothetical protein [Mesonia hippocampi]
MARAMFEYTKEILKKVSFDTKLFCKEVKKAVTHLLPHEVEELRVYILSLIQENPRLSQCLVYIEE